MSTQDFSYQQSCLFHSRTMASIVYIQLFHKPMDVVRTNHTVVFHANGRFSNKSHSNLSHSSFLLFQLKFFLLAHSISCFFRFCSTGFVLDFQCFIFNLVTLAIKYDVCFTQIFSHALLIYRFT
jgi:hypothetical protein